MSAGLQFFRCGAAGGESVSSRTSNHIPTSESEGKDAQPLRPAELIARDAQGRLRMETTEGKFKVDEGEGAGTEAVQQIITICDPVSQKLVRLDTLSKTATMQGRPAGSVRIGTQAQVAFCSVYANKKSVGNAQKEDLGHQTIEGLDAEGVRTTRSVPTIRNGEPATVQGVSEVWCSDELGALVMQARRTGATGQGTETKLTKIARGEPDAALFQIPADYRIVERIPEERKNGQPGTVGSVPATQPAVPAEIHPE